jgi:hypothetical protein
VVIFFGGALDSVNTNMLDVYRNYSYKHHKKLYFPWTGTGIGIDEALIIPDSVYSHTAQVILDSYKDYKICLVGHSYGGDTAMRVARVLGKRVELLITLDPVSKRANPIVRAMGYCMPPQACLKETYWINVYADTELISFAGGHWGHQVFAFENFYMPNTGHASARAMFKRVNYYVDRFPFDGEILLHEVVVKGRAIEKKNTFPSSEKGGIYNVGVTPVYK